MTVQLLRGAGLRGVAVGAGAFALAAAALGLALPAGHAAVAAEAPGQARAGDAGDRLGRLIQERLRADGPFFNAAERAAIEQACGYAAGSWDGHEANMSDGVFTCSNGRRVDTPEMRAVMAAAGPRIGARVSRVMESAEVQEAIGEVAERASAAALASIDAAEIGRRAAAEAQVEVREAMEELERDLAELRRERRRTR